MKKKFALVSNWIACFFVLFGKPIPWIKVNPKNLITTSYISREAIDEIRSVINYKKGAVNVTTEASTEVPR